VRQNDEQMSASVELVELVGFVDMVASGVALLVEALKEISWF
jgi:predicted histidine transporter YuiF (NhaC family)